MRKPANEASVRTGLTFSRELRIEWGDCDPAGIVFYPRYLAFFDANTAWLFEAAGLSRGEIAKSHGTIGLPLIDVQAKFMAPSRFGDRIAIESTVSEWRRTTFVVEHRILRDGELAVQGRETRVWAGIDPTQPGVIKVKPIPQDVIDRFAGAR